MDWFPLRTISAALATLSTRLTALDAFIRDQFSQGPPGPDPAASALGLTVRVSDKPRAKGVVTLLALAFNNRQFAEGTLTPSAVDQDGQPITDAAGQPIDVTTIPVAYASALAENTLRRIARGVWRYVIGSAEPFIVRTAHGDVGLNGSRRWGVGEHPVSEPLPTVTASRDFAVVAPYLVGAGGPAYAGEPRRLDGPAGTVMPSNNTCLVAPTLINTRNGERPDAWRCEDCGHEYERGDLPLCGCTRCGSQADPVLIPGQAPRVRDIAEPMPTVTGSGSQGALVAALLARHYGGHENDGAQLQLPIPTITAKDHHALVATNMVMLRGGFGDHQNTARSLDDPAPAITAQGNHLAEVRAFLVSYYGQGIGQQVTMPMRSVTTHDRFGLVTVHGVDYAIADIGMRMLVPRELFRAQGFPDSYQIDPPVRGKPLTKTAQVRMAGNSVCPPLAAAILRAQFPAREEAVA